MEWSFLECLLVGIRFGVWCVVVGAVAAVVAVVAAGVTFCARTPSSGSECGTQFTTQCSAEFREMQSREYEEFTKLRTSSLLRKMGHLAGWCAPAPQGTKGTKTEKKKEREREAGHATGGSGKRQAAASPPPDLPRYIHKYILYKYCLVCACVCVCVCMCVCVCIGYQYIYICWTCG